MCSYVFHGLFAVSGQEGEENRNSKRMQQKYKCETNFKIKAGRVFFFF